jgi:hypothetical protein
MTSRYRTAFSWVKRCGAASALAGVLGQAACGGEVAPVTGCGEDEARTGRLLALLGGHEASAPLLAGARPRICFVDGPGVLIDGRVALPRGEDDGTAAARLAHLLHHARHGRGLVAGLAVPPGPCEETVEDALAEEAEAHALEIELQAALGAVPSRPFVNAAEILALPRAARAPALLRHLRDHPDGGGGYEPLARDYRARCGGARR